MTLDPAVRCHVRRAGRIVALLVGASTVACSQALDCCGVAPLYRSMNRQVPHFTQPLDIHAAVRTGAGQSAEFAAAMPWYHLAVFADVETSYDTACSTCDFRRYSYTEFGAGRIAGTSGVWVGGGRASSQAFGRDTCTFLQVPCFHYIQAKSTLQRVFVQADNTWQSRRMSLTTSARISHVLSSGHTRLDTPYELHLSLPTRRSAPQGASTGLFLEPTVEGSYGPPSLRLVVQLAAAGVMNGKTNFGYRPLAANVGVATDLSPLKVIGVSR
jgi:hypothetical protein